MNILLTTPIVSVRFFNTEKVYDYFNNGLFNICIGDYVIVPVKDEFTVGQVMCGKTCVDDTINYKKIAYKIDLEKFKTNYKGD